MSISKNSICYQIDAKLISNDSYFHELFAKAFNFPGYYGKNMDAWIDCMSECLDKQGNVLLEITDFQVFNDNFPYLVKNLLECTSFVNKNKSSNKLILILK